MSMVIGDRAEPTEFTEFISQCTWAYMFAAIGHGFVAIQPPLHTEFSEYITPLNLGIYVLCHWLKVRSAKSAHCDVLSKLCWLQPITDAHGCICHRFCGYIFSRTLVLRFTEGPF